MHDENEFSRVRLAGFDPRVNFVRGAGPIKFFLWYLIKISIFLTAFPFPSRFKVWILRKFGAQVGRGVVLKPRINVHFPWKLDVGDDVWIGEEVCILNFEKIAIGNNVCISQRVFLCAGNHDFKDPTMPYRNGPITLQDGCWIGACSFVSPGTSIGFDTVVSACSVVSGELRPNGVYRGNPLLRIKERWT